MPNISYRVIYNRCPITNGLPTKMRKAVFDRMCAKKLRSKNEWGNKTNHYCRKICKGEKIPEELTLI